MVVLKLSWQREKLKQFNTVEFCKGGHASPFFWLKSGAWITRAYKARCRKVETEREFVFR
jgi:hypothetical protein